MASPAAPWAAVVIEVIAPGSDVAAPTKRAPATTSPMPVRSASWSATPDNFVPANAIAAALARNRVTMAQSDRSAIAGMSPLRVQELVTPARRWAGDGDRRSQPVRDVIRQQLKCSKISASRPRTTRKSIRKMMSTVPPMNFSMIVPQYFPQSASLASPTPF